MPFSQQNSAARILILIDIPFASLQLFTPDIHTPKQTRAQQQQFPFTTPAVMTSKAVNVPTNTKIKESDINGKLQLYGIYSAFANGKVPSV